MIKQCQLCGKEYDTTWQFNIGKFCCRDCYKIKDPIYKENEIIWTINNKRPSGLNGDLIAYPAQGRIVRIRRKNIDENENGIFIYDISLIHESKIMQKFYKDVFHNEDDCIQYVNKINKKRDINRKVKEELKKEGLL